MSLGAAVRSVRIASRLTQAEAAALCGVSAPFLSDLERGKQTAQLGSILAVCRGLGIQIQLLPPTPLEAADKRKRLRRARSGT